MRRASRRSSARAPRAGRDQPRRIAPLASSARDLVVAALAISSRLRPPQRDAPRQAVAHRAQRRRGWPASRSASSRRARQLDGLRVVQLGAWPGRAARGRRRRGRGTPPATARRGNRPRPRRPALPSAAAAAAARAAAGCCRRDDTPCCRAARCSRMPPLARAAEATARACPSPGSRPRRPAPTSLDAALAELSRTASLDQRLGAAQEALPVAEALAAGLRRRSMMCIRALMPVRFVSSSRLTRPASPACTTRRAGGPAARCSRASTMRSTNSSCFFSVVAVLLRAEADHRQQILDLAEHPLLDDLADLLVAGPGRVLAAVVGPRAQRELDDLVAEVLRVGDAGRLLDLGRAPG